MIRITFTVFLLSSFLVAAKPYRIMGSYPEYAASMLPLEKVPWQNISHILYSFGLPQKDGSLQVTDTSLMIKTIKAAKANGVVSVLSVGGAVGGEPFALYAKNRNLLDLFVNNTVSMAKKYGFGAVHIDWEHWPEGGRKDSILDQGLEDIMVGLKQKLTPLKIELGIDVFGGAWYGIHYTDKALKAADDIVIMLMDNAGPWSIARPHSDFATFRQGIDYWLGRLPNYQGRWHAVIPYYGRGFMTGYVKGQVDKVNSMHYLDILKKYPGAEEYNNMEDDDYQIWYDGFPAIDEKVEHIKLKKFHGVANWALPFDSQEKSKSLGQRLADSLWSR